MAEMRDDRRKGFTDPVGSLIAANLHASNPLTNGTCDCLYVSAAGDVAFRPVDNAADVTIAFDKGWHPVRASHIRATGTTAIVFVGYR